MTCTLLNGLHNYYINNNHKNTTSKLLDIKKLVTTSINNLLQLFPRMAPLRDENPPFISLIEARDVIENLI